MSSRSPWTTSTPSAASSPARRLSGWRVSARSRQPRGIRWRMTAPPCRPVAPVTRTSRSRSIVTARSLPDLLEGLDDLRVLRLQAAVHGHVVHLVLAEKDEGVSDVIGLVDGLRDSLHHLPLGLRADPRGSVDEDDRHDVLLFPVSSESRSAEARAGRRHPWLRHLGCTLGDDPTPGKERMRQESGPNRSPCRLLP